MKALLNAMKTALQQGLTYVRADDVFITSALEFLPDGMMPPGIGLKDGTIVRRELISGMLEITLQVQIGVFVQVFKDEASLMGDAASHQKGLLEIVPDLHAILDENMLGIFGMQAAFSPSESGSEPVGNDTDLFQRKIITYEYVKEETRP
jgi:hypothetical protein